MATKGILRVDSRKSRRSSTISVVEPTSPQPSVDRLSVSFANEDKKVDNGSIIRTSITEDAKDGEGEEEEEYSASAQVILEKKRDSLRRRGSVADRRRSSVFNSNSESLGSVEDAANQSLRIHKEVVSQLKYQPWPIRRKLRLVRQAKAYIKAHEGQIQERLAQKKSTRDVLEHSKIVFLHYWNYCMRELNNLVNSLSPWETRIKEIESHFGSAVASYFTFHRWLFAVNLKISWALLLCVILPEVFLANNNPGFAGDRKCMFKEEAINSQKFLTLWNFEGILKHSPIFYGYYNSRNTAGSSFQNRLPFFYFVTGVGLYIYSFVAILRKMAENSRHSKLTEKDEYYIFTWKMFTSWDFMIGNPETAHNRTSSIILSFKEALLEEAEKSREEKRNWKLLAVRLASHALVLCLLASSVLLVVVVVGRSEIGQAGREGAKPRGWWRQNEVTVVITLLGMAYPVLFELVGLLEKYHPRKALRLQLARIMVLNLLNLYAFILATFTGINNLSNASCENMPKPDAIQKFIASSQPGFILNNTKFTTEFPVARKDLQSISNLYDPSQESHGINSQIQLPIIPLLSFPSEHIDGFYTPKWTDTTFHLPKHLTNVEHEKFNEDDVHTVQTSTLNHKPDFLISDRTTNQEPPNIETVTTASNINISDDTSQTDPYLLSSTDDAYNETSVEEEESEYNSSSSDAELFSSSGFTAVSTDNQYISSTSINESSDVSDFSIIPTAPHGGTSTHWPTAPLASSTLFDGTSPGHSVSATFLSTEPQTARGVSEALPSTTSPDFNTTEGSNLLPDIMEDCVKREKNKDLSNYTFLLNEKTRKKVHSQCWETMFGQELVKLTVMDLTMTVLSILLSDFLRAVVVRLLNKCWFWDLEKDLPGYGDFKIAENILHLVNNQGMVWMGMFFSPGLPPLNVLKLVLLMYLRSWAVLTCNVPHEVVFKASKSNNFYLWLLLTMLFLCVLPVGCALAWIGPSWHCGPFSKYLRIYSVFTYSLPPAAQTLLYYVFSPGIVLPLLVLLLLIIFYLISLTGALREANDDLKVQLRTERTEERRKVFQMANKKRRGPDASDTPFSKWCQQLNGSHSGKTSIDITSSLAASERHPKPAKSATIKDPKEESQRGPQETIVQLASPPACRPALPSDGTDSETYRGREDSLVSGWSADLIPEIRVSESDSLEQTKRSPDTCSSSKETVIDIGHDDVFLGEEERPETEESSMAHGDSYESISKSLAEMNEIGKKDPPKVADESQESRKSLAKILVDGLMKK